MAKPFRLEAVARVRGARRDAARAHLADAMRAAAILATQREELEARFAELLEERRLAATRVDTAWLLSAGRYELVLRADQRALAEKTDAVEREVDRRRLALAEAERELRAVELLRERALAAEREKAALREARALDEHASRTDHRRRLARREPA